MAEPQEPYPGADRIRSLTDQDAIFSAFDAYPWTKDSAFLVRPKTKHHLISYKLPNPIINHLLISLTFKTPSPASAPSSAPQIPPTHKAPSATSPPTPASSTTPSASASRSISPPTTPGSPRTRTASPRTSSPRSTSSRHPRLRRPLPQLRGSRPRPRQISTSTEVPNLTPVRGNRLTPLVSPR